MKDKKSWIYGKTVVLSGASGGIGKGLCELLISKQNCNVIGIGRNEAKMLALKEELGERGDHFSYKLFDVSAQSEWIKLAEELKSENITIDVLINNAGMLPPFEKTDSYSPEQIKSAMDVNFYSFLYAYYALRDSFPERKSVIVISSAITLASLPGTCAYASSKCAIKACSEALMLENRKDYIANVMPGFTRTDIFREQNTDINSKLIKAFSMPCDKMVKKIYRGILKKRRSMVFGFDAHAMNFLHRLCPRASLKLFAFVMRKANIKLFENVFK